MCGSGIMSSDEGKAGLQLQDPPYVERWKGTLEPGTPRIRSPLRASWPLNFPHEPPTDLASGMPRRNIRKIEQLGERDLSRC
jgi:hypothetical protein